MAAVFACASESLPSVAETSVFSSWRKLYGRAPVWSTSARSFASWTDPMPVISAPFVPGMPFGLSRKLIVGADLISRSRTIANCWA